MTRRKCLENARGRLIAALYQIEEALNYTDLQSRDSLTNTYNASAFTNDAFVMIQAGKKMN